MEEDKIILKLLEISLRIRNCYLSLISIDSNNQKDNNEYNETLDELKLLIIEEEKIYDDINDRELIQNLLLKISLKDRINNILYDIDSLINPMDDFIKRRVILKLLGKKQIIDKKRLLKMAIELNSEMKANNIKNIDNSYYKLVNLLDLSEALKKDFINNLLINIKKHKEVSNEICLNLMYNCSFLFDFCEQKLLESHFEIDEKVEYVNELVVKINNLKKEEVDNTKELFGINVIDYLSEKKENETAKIIIMTALAFCKPEEIKRLVFDEYYLKLIKKW